MDIKTRIEGLSEAEAKAALSWYAEKMALWLSCNDCPDMSECRASYKTAMLKTCQERIFALALEEARK